MVSMPAWPDSGESSLPGLKTASHFVLTWWREDMFSGVASSSSKGTNFIMGPQPHDLI